MKYIVVVISLFLFTFTALAGGWSASAVPTKIDIDRNYGFMVYGSFGNSGDCTISNRFYVRKDHGQYDKVYSTILAAYMAGKKIQVYIHACEPKGWYAVNTVTFNTVTPSGAVNIVN